MDKLWQHHFKYYDLFQNNFSNYRETIKLHVKELTNCKKILDTGAGTGNLTFELLKQGKKVTAIDSNEYSLEILKGKCESYKENLRIMKIDVQKLYFDDGKFDGASSMFVIPFVKDNKRYFSEVYRVLKNGAKFTISAWTSTPVQGLTTQLKEELEQKGILPKYEKEWSYIQESVKETRKQVEKSLTLTKLKMMLKDTGFKNIKELENPYGKYVYFLVCNK